MRLNEYDVRRYLEKALDSLIAPLGIEDYLNNIPEGQEDDIFDELKHLKEMIERRIEVLKAAEAAEFAKGAER